MTKSPAICGALLAIVMALPTCGCSTGGATNKTATASGLSPRGSSDADLAHRAQTDSFPTAAQAGIR
jgi:hypothetical protein